MARTGLKPGKADAILQAVAALLPAVHEHLKDRNKGLAAQVADLQGTVGAVLEDPAGAERPPDPAVPPPGRHARAVPLGKPVVLTDAHLAHLAGGGTLVLAGGRVLVEVAGRHGLAKRHLRV